MMTLREASAAMHGLLCGLDRAFASVSTDSRSLAPGALFFAVRGERFDGLHFVPQALAAGAAAAVVPHGALPSLPAGASAIEVDDVRTALGRLAAHWRSTFQLPLVAVTGSNGKTTVKDMISGVLACGAGAAERVLATEGNLNNDLGVPLTLLRLGAHHRYAVIEMGMNHAGEIRYLSGLARPDVAVVTNAGTAHIGLLGSVEAVARAKAEIYDGLADSGIGIVNADDAHAELWLASNARRRTITFGLEASADVSGRFRADAFGSDVSIRAPAWEVDTRLEVPGRHNVMNALAAAAVAHALGIDPASVQRGLAGFRGPKGRMQRCAGRNGAVLVDDSYNANTDSALAAITVLAAMPGKRILVLGDMAELGARSFEEHTRVGAAARASGIDRLFTFGADSARASEAFSVPARHFARIEDLLAALEPELDPRAVVLVKGSRCMRMERVVQAFAAEKA